MKTCEKCGVEIEYGTRGSYDDGRLHTPERCRDHLAARLTTANGAFERALRTLLKPGLSPGFRIRETTSIVNEALAAISAAGGKETGK